MGRAELKRVVPLTPPGGAAVAVLGLQGHPSRLQLTGRNGQPRAWPEPDRVVVGRLVEGTTLVDEVVVVGRVGGVELHVHGGRGVVAAVLGALERDGFEVSSTECPEPSELAPSCLRAARAWLSARSGPLADLVRRANAALVAGIVEPTLAAELNDCLSRQAFAKRLRRPAVVRIVGRPNAGKSTLFNALLGSQRALVSPHAGTTRDSVTATWRVRGVPVLLEDTAGRPGAGWPAGIGAGADLLIHLRSEADEAGPADPPGVTLAVLGKADRQPPGAFPATVSGHTGAGLSELVERVADRLDLDPSEAKDGRVPVDPAQVGLLVRAAALPPAPRRHCSSSGL